MKLVAGLSSSGLLSALACSPAAEPARVELEVVVDTAGFGPVETDLGYLVEVTEARLAIADLEFTVAGEAHAASLWQRAGDALISRAHAHPGHAEGGDVAGVLEGRFLPAWPPGDGARLGTATLIAGAYQAANFMFARGLPEDGLEPGDPLLGHTAVFVARATRGAFATDISAVIDAPEGRQLVGAPFQAEVGPEMQADIGFALLLRDPVTETSLFDGIDFTALSSASGGTIAIELGAADPATQGAYERLRRACLTHDYFRLAIGPAD